MASYALRKQSQTPSFRRKWNRSAFPTLTEGAILSPPCEANKGEIKTGSSIHHVSPINRIQHLVDISAIDFAAF